MSDVNLGVIFPAPRDDYDRQLQNALQDTLRKIEDHLSVMDRDLEHKGTNLGMFSTTPTSKQTVTGSRGGNAALQNLLTALSNYGLVTDSTT